MSESATADCTARLSDVAREHCSRLMVLRDEYVEQSSNGRFKDAAAYEWRRLPSVWRMTLLLVAGIGVDAGNLDTLANREWREMPEPEREAVRSVVRLCKKHVGALTALAARV